MAAKNQQHQRLRLAEIEDFNGDTDVPIPQDQDQQQYLTAGESPFVNDGIRLGSKKRSQQPKMPKFTSKHMRNTIEAHGGVSPGGEMAGHSPLAFQVKKSLSKKNILRKSPSVDSYKVRLSKSPSWDNRSTIQHNSSSRRSLKNRGIVTMSHRANLNASLARNSNRGIVTMSSRNERSGTLRVKSARRKGSALSFRSAESRLSGTVPMNNDACNQYYDKNLGKAYDRFNSQFQHMRKLQEIRETDRSVKSRLSSGSSRSGITLNKQRTAKYQENHQMHLQFTTREHSNDINRKNERLFNRLQEIHAKKKVTRDRSSAPHQFQGVTSISSPIGIASLNFPAKKKEAARIDADNYRFAQRIMNQKPLVEHVNTMNQSHKKKLKTLQMISHNSRVSINKLMQQNVKRFAHVEPPLQSFNKLPPLTSPKNANFSTFDLDGLAKKRIVQKDSHRRTKSFAKKRSSLPPNSGPNVNFTFATNKAPKILTHTIDESSGQIQGGEMDISAQSNMNNSQKRKIKRTFPRPKASSILGLDKDDPISMGQTVSTNQARDDVPATKETVNLYSSIEASSLEHPQKLEAKMPSAFDQSPELAHPPRVVIREEGQPPQPQHQHHQSRSPMHIVSSSGQEQYYTSGGQSSIAKMHVPQGRKQPIRAKRLPVIRDSSTSRRSKHGSATPRRFSQKVHKSGQQAIKDASFRGNKVQMKQHGHFQKKHHSVVTTKAQDEKILQLSKMAMNTDSSQMLYPDFTAANMQSLPVGNMADYYDASDPRGHRHGKKNMVPKHFERAPQLNQTEYFTMRQQEPIKPQPQSSRNRKEGPITAHHSMQDDRGFLIFEQGSDKSNMGTHFVKPSEPLSTKGLGSETPGLNSNHDPPSQQTNGQPKSHTLPSALHLNQQSPTPDESPDKNENEPQPAHISPSPPAKGRGSAEANLDSVDIGNNAQMVPLRVDPANNLPFILQKQQLLTKVKSRETIGMRKSHESPAKPNDDLKNC